MQRILFLFLLFSSPSFAEEIKLPQIDLSYCIKNDLKIIKSTPYCEKFKKQLLEIPEPSCASAVTNVARINILSQALKENCRTQ